MHLIIDIDGVLADQVAPVLKELNRRYSLQLTKSQIRRWDQPIAATDIKTELEKSLANPQFILGLRLIPGARAAMSELAKRHEITIATTRGSESDFATKEWLRRKQIPYHKYVNCFALSKADIHGALLIDDYPLNISAFAATGRPAILFDQPWNQHDAAVETLIQQGRVVRAHNWSHVLRSVRSFGSTFA